jgi:hypothetical protein
MATRKELITAVGQRYREASKGDRTKILDEFAELTKYHRKHAIRVLTNAPCGPRPKLARNPLYDEAVRQALIVLWEAADRLCGKRLKALIPMLIDAMERHGHLSLDPAVKEKLLVVSAATIDRALRATREQIDGKRRRRSGVGAAIRRSIPVRTFSDWRNPPPGFFEVDMVEHCGGPKTDGNYVHSLVLTDIASGWTECVAMPVRNQLLVVQGMAKVAADLPFPMLGVDTDNDSAFMNETVFDYCKELGLEQTRSRAYKKNDQAWVEQKNGSIVRRLVGYGRLSGRVATQALAELYAVSRLYINFFQPSFKLKLKMRDGARVRKTYYPPMTPCDRLLGLPNVPETTKAKLRHQFIALDPVQLLQGIRLAQNALASLAEIRTHEPTPTAPIVDVTTFLSSLSKAWQDGEVRPTHRTQPRRPHWWRTRADPFEHAWPVVEHWLESESTITAKEMMARLAVMVPDAYATKAQLRTLQRRVKQWRAQKAKDLILGTLRESTGKSEDANAAARSPSTQRQNISQ